MLWVRLPPLLCACVGWALASLSGCNPPAETLCRFNSCPTHSKGQKSEVRSQKQTWVTGPPTSDSCPGGPVRLWPPGFHPGDRGFKSRPGCSWPSGGMADAMVSKAVAFGREGSNPSLATCRDQESGVRDQESVVRSQTFPDP